MVKIVPAKESLIVPFCLTCGMRWLILFFVLSSVQMSAQINFGWVGDTSIVVVVITEQDTSFQIRRFDSRREWILYYDIEQESKAAHIDNSPEKKDTTWYRNGQIKTTHLATPKYCQLCHKSKSWYPNGVLKWEISCTQDTCSTNQYYPSGKIKKITFGTIDSVHQVYFNTRYITNYHENGSIMSIEIYKNSQAKIEYEQSIRTGTWSYYNESGKLHKEEFYEEGKLVKTIEY